MLKIGAAFEYAKENMTLKAAFKSLSLKKIKRRDTKADEVRPLIWFCAC